MKMCLKPAKPSTHPSAGLLVACLLLGMAFAQNSLAAKWVKLNENSQTKLMLDKQSVTQQDLLKKAWVKLDYKTLQDNPETLGAQYNASKLLWFFDCSAQTAATSQVLQYHDSELIYSARVDIKDAEFLEPVPDSALDIAMRQVCQSGKTTPAASAKTPNSPATAKPESKLETKLETNPETKPENNTEPKPKNPPDNELALKPEESATAKAAKKGPSKPPATEAKQSTAQDTDWSYDSAEAADEKASHEKDLHGKVVHEKAANKKASNKKTAGSKTGPAHWGKLAPEFATCDSGKNQSPINIDTSMHASLKAFRATHRFAAKEIFNNGHTVQINFKSGNMVVLDTVAYQLSNMQFHAPSENQIKGKSFPLEAHFVHTDAKGHVAIIGVLFEEGDENPALAKLWAQMPHTQSAPTAITARVKPSDLMPTSKSYYRFSGSLTTPPCSEGVSWLLMKSPISASKAQIETFAKAVKQHNNRPIQPLNGRLIVE